MTGGAGFLGQALTKRLCELGAKVVVLDDLSQGRTENLPKHNAVRFIQGSVLRPPCVQAAMAGADLVYHLAGVVGMRRTTASPLYAFDVSATGTKNVLDFAGKAQIVLFSSSAVYGIDHAKDATEDARLDRLAAYKYDGYCKGYASGKQEMERLGLVAANAGQDVTILRPFNIVGPGQSDEAGLVLPTFMRQSLSGEALTIFDDGSQRRLFSDIHTFTDCVLQLSHPREGWKKRVNIVDIGTRETNSILELAETVVQITGSRSSLTFRPYHEVFPNKRDVRERIPNVEKLHSIMGQVKWRSVSDIVHEVVWWARQ